MTSNSVHSVKCSPKQRCYTTHRHCIVCTSVHSVTLRPATSTERLLRSIRSHVRGANLLRCDDNKVTITIPALQTGKLTGSPLHDHHISLVNYSSDIFLSGGEGGVGANTKTKGSTQLFII